MKAELQEALSSSFLAFARKAFASIHKGKMLNPQPYVELIAGELELVAQRKTKRLVVNLPPRHLKTFMDSICLPAWILAHEPGAKILVLTYGQELADKIAVSTRDIMQSSWYRQTFDTRLKKNRTKLDDFLTTAGGGVRSVSIHGGVTGIGGDFIIIDDPVEIKDHDNTRQLERVNDLFDNEIWTRMDTPNAACIVISAHRVSEDDLPGHVLKQRGWTHIKLPLIAPRKKTYLLPSGKKWRRRKGDLLRPDAFGKRDIDALRASKSPGFETLQQQNPSGSQQIRIKAKHFPIIDFSTLPLSDLAVVLSIDPGQRGGPENSFSVVQAWVSFEGKYVLIDQWREQASYRQFKTAVNSFIRRYRPSIVLIECTGQGPALLSDLREQRGMQIIPINPTVSKFERVHKHRRIIRAGKIQLLQDAQYSAEFLAEVTLFPYGPYDDQMDALTQFLDYILENPNPQKRPPSALMQVGYYSRPLQQTTPVAPNTAATRLVVALNSRHFRK